MKHFTNLRWLIMSFLLAVGVSAWGASATYQHIFTTKPSIGNNTLSTINWTVSGNNIGNYNSANYCGVQFGTKSNNGSIVLTSADAWGGQTSTSYTGYTNVTEVRVWMNAGTDTPSATVTIGGVAATSDGTVVQKNSSAHSYADATCVTYTPASNGNTGVIVINASTSSKAGYLCAIEIDCEEPGGNTPTLTDPEFAFSPATATWTSGSTFTAPTLSYVNGYDGTVQYSSSNTSVATVNSSGTVTPHATGTAEIRAYADATSTYEAVTEGDVYYTLTVVGPSAPTITPADGTTFSGPQSVTITGTNGNTIYYTTDGTDPTTSSTQYNAPFTVSGNVTVKAIQVDSNGLASNVASASYTDSSVQSTEITAQWVASAQGYTSGEQVGTSPSAIDSNVSVSFTQNGTNGSKYYSTGAAVRVYSGNSFTVAGGTGVTIKSITITFASGEGTNTITVDSGTYSNGTWTGTASSVTFSVGGTSGHRRIASIDVTYETEGGSSLLAANLKFSNAVSYNMTMEVGDVNSANFTKDTDATVTFTFSPTGVATYDSSTGNVTAVAEGTTTLTAYAAATSTYDEGTATLNITVNKKPHGLEYEPNSYSITVGDAFTTPTLTNPNNLTVTYSGNNDDLATVNSSTGALTFVSGATGTITVTATTEGNSTYAAGTATYTLRVLPQASGSDTYTKVTSASDLEVGAEYLIVYETDEVALAAISDTNTKYGTRESVTISSETITITNEPVAVLTLGLGNNDENWSFKSSLDDKYLYWGSGNSLNSNANLSDNTSWTLSFDNGDLVMTNLVQDSGSDRILRYNNNSGQERFACYKGTQQPIQLYKKASSSPRIRFESATAEVNIGETYTQTATPSNVEGLSYTITYSSGNGCASVNSSTGEVEGVYAGTAVITATMTIGQDTYTTTYTITVVDPNRPGTENNPYTVAEAIYALDNNGEVTGVYATGIVSEIVQAYNSQYDNITYKISTDGLTTSAQLESYHGKGREGNDPISAEDIKVGDAVIIHGTLQKYGNDTYEFSQGNVLVDKKSPLSVTVGTTTYATLYNGTSPMVVPTGMTAYTMHVKDVNGYKDVERGLTLTPGTKIAAGTAVILQAAQNEYSFSQSFETVEVNDANNVLMGSDEATTFNDPAYEYFVLGKLGDIVGFYHQKGTGGTSVNNGAHKCFLRIPAGESILNDTGSEAAMRGGFSLEAIIATTINRYEVEQSKTDGAIYNLAGQRVEQPTKGIYIVNGKKVLFK